MRLWSMAPKGASVSGWRWLSPLARVPAALVWGCLLLTSWPLLALARRLLPPLLPEVLFCAPGAGRRLALTIDDGPSPRSDQLLDLLRELQVPATLFLIGDHLERCPAGFVARALAGGHLIGNHMWVDEVSARLDGAAFAAELRHTELALQVPMRWFRPGAAGFTSRCCASCRPPATAWPSAPCSPSTPSTHRPGSSAAFCSSMPIPAA
jgi:peptidoglycan/xylan/chitin deacetylase (PgdA/CDA1 family)